MPTITKMLTPVNYTKGASNRAITYIVIHWVGAVSSAKNNAKYFQSKRSASAHYFVDDNDIYQIIEDQNIAWHCGTKGTYFHKYARNSNSIGIEMCLDRAGHISDKTIANTAGLVQSLMKKYGIPASRVIRHYDVTHKSCPGCYISAASWNPVYKTLIDGVVENQTADVISHKDATTVGLYGVVDVDSPDTLNVRADANAKASKVGSLNEGAIIYVSKSYNGWYYITQAGNMKGWVNAKYVTLGDKKIINTKSGNLNMRSGRGTKYGILKTLPKGATVTQLRQYSDGWSKVIYDYVVGYVSTQYLK